MSLASRSLGITCALAVLGSAGAVRGQTYYSLTGGSGAQLQLGNDFFLPVQTGYTSLFPSMTGFPPLRIPRQKNPSEALVKQTAGPDPKRITIPPAVLHRPAPGAKR